MLAVNGKEEKLYGCPNCGCDTWTRDSCYRGDQPSGTCKSCKLHYQIMADGITESSMRFGTNRKDENGETIFESPHLIPHPRKGIPAWKYEYPDSKPEVGEYWSPRGIGYDLSGFVKSKQAGERLLQMVKDVLGNSDPKSWLDYRPSEPEWIQFKFQDSEFDLKKISELCSENKIITIEILEQCKHSVEKIVEFRNKYSGVNVGCSEYLSEITDKLDQLAGITELSHFKHYVLAGESFVKNGKLPIRVPGGTVGEIVIDKNSVIERISVSMDYVVKTYSENTAEEIRQFVGSKIMLKAKTLVKINDERVKD